MAPSVLTAILVITIVTAATLLASCHATDALIHTQRARAQRGEGGGAPLRGAREHHRVGDYPVSLAKTCVYLSGAAYCESVDLEAWNPKTCVACSQVPGISQVQTFSYSSLTVSSFGYVAYSSALKAIIVSFRGSTDLPNWLDNLDALKTQFFNSTSVEVHAGFYDAYMSVRGDILKKYVALRTAYATARTIITGHSLGAAMATICAADFMLQWPLLDATLITFGSPRVGNAAFYATFMKIFPPNSAWRVTHFKDIVPTVPAAFMGFHHLPREIWYTEDSSSYTVCDGTGEDASCEPFGTSVADHLHYLGIRINCALA